MAAPKMAEGRTVVVEIPGLPLSANARRRSHWTVQYRDSKTYRALSAAHARLAHSGPPFERAVVRALLHYPRGPLRDPDSAVSSLKPALDGLIDGGVLADDSLAHITLAVQQQITPGARGVRLEIEEVVW